MALSLLKSLKPVAGRALQIALNRALALDPDTRHALTSLDGRHIDLTLEAPSLAMRISVDGDQLRVGPVDAQEADLAVRSSLAGVLAQLPLLANARRGDNNGKGRVRVRFMSPSVSRSQTWFRAAAPPATRAVPISVWAASASATPSGDAR